MLHRILLTTFFLFGLFLPQSQRQQINAPGLSLFQKAEALYHSDAPNDITDSTAYADYLLAIAQVKQEGTGDSILPGCFLHAGILAMQKQLPREALNLFNSLITGKKLHPEWHDTLLFQPLMYSGSIYYSLNNLDSALSYYRSAESLLNRFPTISESERLENKLGALYYETGDYRKSIPYFEKALSVLQSKPNPDPYFTVNYRNNIASALRKLGNADSALSIYRSLLNFHINEKELLQNIGVTLLDAGRYAEAIEYLHKGETETSNVYNHLATAYTRINQPAEAAGYLEQAQKIYHEKGDPPNDFDYANTLAAYGDLAQANGIPRDALRYYQLAIIQLKSDFADTVPAANPRNFSRLGNSFLLFDLLVAKARAFRSMLNGGNEAALSTYSAALKLAKQVELRYTSDESRLFLNQKVTPACKEAIDMAVRMFGSTRNTAYADSAFRWSEGNKAAVLQAGLFDLQMDSLAGMPPGLFDQLKNARALLAKLNLRNSLLPVADSDTLLYRKITDLEIEISQINEKLQAIPAYQQLLFSGKTISMDSIRNHLVAPDAAMVSYYYTDHYLLQFYVTREANGMVYAKVDSGFLSTLRQYRSELNAGVAADRQQMDKLSAVIYHALIAPVADRITGKKRLIVVPYNEIGYLPFESLVNPADQNNYLLKKFAISYRYSANFMHQQEGIGRSAYQVLAFAPYATVQDENKNFSVLSASKKEVENLGKSVYLDQQATKDLFIRESGKFPIIHLATHAVANDKEPLQSYISFAASQKSGDTASQLFESEIYHLNMANTQLVILSACETGSGMLVNSEGIMSLSRAFAYAGCPSVITSLWKADDASTAFITGRMHVYLSAGRSIDLALQQAKIDYLESNSTDLRFKTPAFWAHLVLAGDYEPVVKKNFLLPWLILVLSGIAFFLAAFIYFKKRTGRR